MEAIQIKNQGDDLVIIAKSEYDSLRQKLDMAIEKRRIEQDRETAIPHIYFHRVMQGENPIRVYREWRELSQQDLADAVGVAQSYIHNLENGKRRGDIILYAKVANTLNVTIDDLAPVVD